jgi:hypothetical protein
MLVVIVIGDIDLANLLVAVASVNLRDHANLQTPVGRDSEITQQAFSKRKLPARM